MYPLIGAAIGAALGATNYTMFIGFVERALRSKDTSQTPEEREAFDSKISLMRRLILGTEVLLLAAVGYWAGKLFAS